MDTAMKPFWSELESGEVHIRDKWQFELKSEFFAGTAGKSREYVQEFFLFVPDSLQINAESYKKELFYQDRTTLIRYKTPEFRLNELINSSETPLAEILNLSAKKNTPKNAQEFSYQLKLFGNVVRSSCRAEVKELCQLLNKEKENFLVFNAKALQLCAELKTLRKKFSGLRKDADETWKNDSFEKQLNYIDEFIAYVIQNYLAVALEAIREQQNAAQLAPADEAISELLMEQGSGFYFKDIREDEFEMEKILYRRGLLNKFVLDVLLLAIHRLSLNERYYHWIGALSAAVAMFIFISLYVWLGTVFVINSIPFFALTVLIYVLKDRIKEGLRFLSFRQASKWFPDFTTVIFAPQNKRFGVLKETFSFLPHQRLSAEVLKMRNKEFHQILEAFQRPEAVLYYKRIVQIEKIRSFPYIKSRGINIIFRFNIFKFLRKAGGPYETHLVMDPTTQKLVRVRFPKVYHLNLIIRSSSVQEDGAQKLEFKKLRIVINKNGIKRIEQLRH